MVTIFVIGILVALLVDETTGIKPGGIIVPGFLALYLGEPLRVLFTILVSLLVYTIILGLQRYVFLYGKRRFAYAIVTGLAIKLLLAMALPNLMFLPFGLLIIGMVIPGLMGETFLQQGIWKTLLAIIVATAITRLLAYAFMGWML